jgi:hypothetical protein
MPDILLTPTNPISSSFHVEGLTCEGRNLVSALNHSGFLRTPGVIAGTLEMNDLMMLVGQRKLTVETDWTCAGRAVAS